jgi:hypothetical protein
MQRKRVSGATRAMAQMHSQCSRPWEGALRQDRDGRLSDRPERQRHRQLGGRILGRHEPVLINL